MKLLQRAIWALILSAALAGFADNLGRTSTAHLHFRVLPLGLKPQVPGGTSYAVSPH